MGRKKVPRLTPEKEDEIIDLVLSGEKDMTDYALAAGFKNRAQFQRYLMNHPEFLAEFDLAKAIDGRRLEEWLLKIPFQVPDPKKAEILSKNILAGLKFLDRKRYGDKIDMDVNQTIDIIGALNDAKSRVIDVTPSIPAAAPILAPPKTDFVQESKTQTPKFEIVPWPNAEPEEKRALDQIIKDKSLGPPIPRKPD